MLNVCISIRCDHLLELHLFIFMHTCYIHAHVRMHIHTCDRTCTHTHATVHTHILYIYSILPNWKLQGTDENGSSYREFKLSGVQVIGGSSYRDYTVSTHACTVTHTRAQIHTCMYAHHHAHRDTRVCRYLYPPPPPPPPHTHTHTYTHTEINMPIHTYIHTINMCNSKFLTVHDLLSTMMKIVYGLRNIFTVNHINIPSI